RRLRRSRVVRSSAIGSQVRRLLPPGFEALRGPAFGERSDSRRLRRSRFRASKLVTLPKSLLAK
ncbi:MAG: hypothetical protein AAGD07_22165, partial [Planctomycetota bacterium]